MPPTLRTVAVAAVILAWVAPNPAFAQRRPFAVQPLSPVAGATPRNVLFILADDHRYDAMGFMRPPFVKTPNIDRIAQRGVHLRNAFVTTALCSPSRATILTGLYAHQHKVVDNNTPVPAGTTFFPQYLQRAGYQTAFVGKWHMGGDERRPAAGLRPLGELPGTGHYLPSADGLNVDGKPVPQKGYITDELTDYALDWLRATRPRRGRSSSTCRTRPSTTTTSRRRAARTSSRPSGTAGQFEGSTFTPPKSAELPARRRRRRRPELGAEPAQQLARRRLPVPQHARRRATSSSATPRRCWPSTTASAACSTTCESEKLLDSTLVIYMGDNGFAFGEHGLIDKRTAYEESMRVPMVMQCPELFPGGRDGRCRSSRTSTSRRRSSRPRASQPPAGMMGESLLPLARGEQRALAHGAALRVLLGAQLPADADDLRAAGGPLQVHPLPRPLGHRRAVRPPGRPARDDATSPTRRSTPQRVQQMSGRLFALLAETNGTAIPLYPDRGPGHRASGARCARGGAIPAGLHCAAVEGKPELA